MIIAPAEWMTCNIYRVTRLAVSTIYFGHKAGKWYDNCFQSSCRTSSSPYREEQNLEFALPCIAEPRVRPTMQSRTSSSPYPAEQNFESALRCREEPRVRPTVQSRKSSSLYHAEKNLENLESALPCRAEPREPRVRPTMLSRTSKTSRSPYHAEKIWQKSSLLTINRFRGNIFEQPPINF